MTDRPTLRKPKLHFDTTTNPSHVTFDDGEERRNFPWFSYTVARWTAAEPDLIKIEIGETLIVLRGHNVVPLYLAIEEHTLLRVRAQPDLAHDREREIDSFAVEIRFLKPPPKQGQIEFDLGA